MYGSPHPESVFSAGDRIRNLNTAHVGCVSMGFVYQSVVGPHNDIADSDAIESA